MNSRYQYWIFEQEEPQLCEPTPRGYMKKQKPTFLEKIDLMNDWIDKYGIEDFKKRMKEDEERQKRMQKYLDNED